MSKLKQGPSATAQGNKSNSIQKINGPTKGYVPRTTMRGVKHVIANLDASVIERRADSSCDNSMLNTTVKSLLRA